MTGSNPAKIRADLARGHIALGELATAHACLARVVADAPDLLGLDDLLDALVQTCEASGAPELESARALRSSWLASFAEPEICADEPMQRAPPSDALTRERIGRHAVQIARLEAWLEGVRRRYEGGVHDVS